MAQALAKRIYDGDAAAFAEGEELMATWERFSETLGEIDYLRILERLVGIRELVDAVLIACGEGDNDAVTPDVWERLRPFRLERCRRQLEHWIAQVDAMEKAGTLGADGDELLRPSTRPVGVDRCRHRTRRRLMRRHLIPPSTACSATTCVAMLPSAQRVDRSAAS